MTTAPPTLAAREAAYDRFVLDNLPRNYLANFVYGMLGAHGRLNGGHLDHLVALLHAHGPVVLVQDQVIGGQVSRIVRQI